MKKNLLYLSLCLIAFGISESMAQQDPQYTQYMYNQNVFNPAYAGTRDAFNATALYREQWSGLEGAPQTLTFSGSSPIGENVGLGLSVISDEIGPVQENNFYADFSYKFQVSANTKLSLGLKAGITSHDIRLTGVDLNNPNDPIFQNDVDETTFNIGAGAFWYGDNFYLGASMPNFLEGVHLDDGDDEIGTEARHYFVTGGYIFDLSSNVKFKPNFLVKGALDSPMSFDLNTNFLLYDLVELGASYRYEDSFSGLIGMYISNNVQVGYAYDRVTSDISYIANSSHEVFVTFNFGFPRRVMETPRFF